MTALKKTLVLKFVEHTSTKSLKIFLALSTLFFSSLVFANTVHAPAYPTLQFDSANNNWPTTFTPINKLAYISGIISLGKNSFAYGCATVQERCGHTVGGKLVAFNDGTGWQDPQPIQGIEKITPPFIAQYPDTLQSPAVWIIGLNNHASYLLSYFNGKTISPAMSFPFAPDVSHPSFFFESHHLGYAIDYNFNRVFYTSNTQWNAVPTNFPGNIAAVTTDKSTDDLYVLGLDTSKNPNRYFITHLTSNNQWSPPKYIDLYRSNTTFLRDIMVMNGGRIINVLNQNSAGVQVIVSQSGGQHFFNKGNIPYSGDMPANPTFGLIYNGNKGNIFWSIISHAQGFYDSVAYLDTNSPNPEWIQDNLPEPMTANHTWNATSNDGTQLWIYGSTDSHQYKVYYYDMKRGIVDTQLSQHNTIRFLEAMDKGKAFGIGIHTIGLGKIWTGYYFDGETWKITPWAGVTPPFILPLPSGGTRNSWPLTWEPDNRYNFIVDESAKNIWVYLSLII